MLPAMFMSVILLWSGRLEITSLCTDVIIYFVLLVEQFSLDA